MSYFYTILGLIGSFLSWVLGLFEKPVTPTPSETEPEEYPIIHYGCPNSKRIQKLNVNRKLYGFRED